MPQLTVIQIFAFFWYCLLFIYFTPDPLSWGLAEYDKLFKDDIYLSTPLSALIYHTAALGTWHTWSNLIPSAVVWGSSSPFFFLLLLIKVRFSLMKGFYKETYFIIIMMLAGRLNKGSLFISTALPLNDFWKFPLHWTSLLLCLLWDFIPSNFKIV